MMQPAVNAFPVPYIAVLTAHSHIRIANNERVELRGLWGEEPAKTIIENRMTGIEEQSARPIDLRFVVSGKSFSIENANISAIGAVNNLVPILSLIGNASIDQPATKLIIRTEPNGEQTFAQFIANVERPPNELRRIEGFWIGAVLDAFGQCADGEWIARAGSQYALAMNYWVRAGADSLVVAHLFMGLEAIKGFALERELRLRGMSKAKLAKEWHVCTSQLQNEARLRLLCNNDVVVHTAAREASNGFEHGTLRYRDIESRVAISKTALAAYLRASIFRLIELDGALQNLLTSPPYDLPLLPAAILAFSGQLARETTVDQVREACYTVLDTRDSVTHSVYDQNTDSYRATSIRLDNANVNATVSGMFFRPSPLNLEPPELAVSVSPQERQE